MQQYLASTAILNSDHPKIQIFANKVTEGSRADIQKAVRIYYAVRDGWKYNPYNISFNPDNMRASAVLEREEGHCLDKANLMITLLRAVGIPARLCLAKVRNHIAAEQMTQAFGTDELTPHGYVEVYLHNRWIKATPAFNKELCDKLNVAPLDWDGSNDSIFQEFDKVGGQFMEYLEDYGAFDDLPAEFIKANMKQHYPKFYREDVEWTKELFFAGI
ncbi:MAG: transglutaminase-like domain-containing protein [Saprospiraceae bacterium]